MIKPFSACLWIFLLLAMSAAAQAALVTHSADTDFSGAMSRIADENTTSSTQLISAYRELPADINTVGLWHLNEGSGTSAADSSGRGNTGTLVNGTAWNTTANSRLGSSSLSFDGINDYVSTTDNAAIPDAITLEVWAKRAVSGTSQSIISWGPNDATANGIEMYITTSNNLYFRVRSGSGANEVIVHTNETIPSGQWLHIAGTQSSVTAIPLIYINGKQVATITDSSQTPTRVSGNKYIGHGVIQTYKFNGSIDEVRISNVARTPEEIMADAQRRPYGVYTSQTMNLGRVSAFNSLSWTEQGVQTGDGETLFNSTGLVAQWNFNEGSGTLAKDSVSTFSTDTTGNLTNNLTAYWKLDEASGTRYDAKGGNNLTDQNTVTSNPGKQGNAGQFNSTNSEYLNISDNADLSTGDIDFTVAAWVYFDSFGVNRRVLMKGDEAATTMEYRLYLNSGTNRLVLEVAANGASPQSSVTANTFGELSTATWYFVVAWHDTGSDIIGISINNVSDTASATNHPSDLGGPFVIGVEGSGASAYMNGRIDEVAFWKRALTQQERTDLYNAGSGQSYSNSGTLINFSSTASQDAAAGTGWTANNRRWGAGALMFDGTNDYVSVADNNALDITGAITIEAWIKPNGNPSAGNRYTILSKFDDAPPADTGYMLDIINNAGSLGYRLSFNATQYIHYTTISQEWHHVTATADGTNVKIYLNGNLKQTIAQTANPSANTVILAVGQRSEGTQLFNGAIDSTRVYNRSLTPEEILANYQAGNIEFQTRTSADNSTWEAWKPVTSEAALDAVDSLSPVEKISQTNLTAYWKLDETSGSRADSKGSNNLTDTNTVTYAPGRLGNAGQFTRANSEYLKVTSPTADLQIANGDSVTIAAWVMLDSASGGTSMFIAGIDEGAAIFDLQYNDGLQRFRAVINNGAAGVNADNLGAATTGIWYFVVAWYDPVADQLGISVNNIPETPTSYATNITAASTPFYIGAMRPTPIQFWDGKIDEVAFWKRTLTAAERTRLFEDGLDLHGAGSGRIYRSADTTTKIEGTASEKLQIGAPQVDGSTVGLWRFEETNGTGAYVRDGVPGFAVSTNGTLQSNLVAYWKLDETSGTRYDNVGGNNLTDQNTVTSAAGKQGNAGQFTAANSEYLNISDNAALSTGDIDFSIAGWVYFDSLVNSAIVSKGDANGANTKAYELAYEYPTNKFYLMIGNNGAQWGISYANSFGSASTGTWYFVVGWHDSVANTINIQINNGAVDSTSYTYGSFDSSQDLNIGAAPTGTPTSGHANFWDGRIDEVGFWKKVLTAQERTDLYNAGGGQTRAGPGSNHGTPTGTAAAQGFYGKGRSFNGSQYISVGDSDAFTLSSGFTLEAWIKSTTLTNYDNIISKYTDGGTASEYRMEMDGASLFDCTVFDNNTGSEGYIGRTAPYGTTFFNDGKWHHVACTYGGGTTSASVKIYIDGVQADTANYQGAGPFTSIRNTASPLLIGAFTTTSYFFNGTIDEAKVSNVARSAEEIAEAYRAGRDHRLTKTITSTDLSAKTKLPFYVAADRPGTYMEATVGESSLLNMFGGDTDMKGYWPLDEHSTGAAAVTRRDYSGNGNSLTDTNTVGSTQGKIGKAGQFTAANNESLSIADNAALSTGNIDFTISAWAYLDSLAAYAVVSKTNSTGNQREYRINFDGTDNFVFFVSPDGGGETYVILSSTTVVTTGTWYLVTAWHDSVANTINIQVNNGPVDSTSYSSGVFDGTSDFFIGNSYAGAASSDHWNGRIDNVMFIKRVLTADERRQMFEIGRRTHPITIDFVTSPQAAYSSGTSVTINNPWGTTNLTDTLSIGDTIIFKENVNGTETVGQATVTAITNTASTYGTVTVDVAPSFPTGGYTTNATVFKWQREYWDITGPMDGHVDAATRVTLRVTDGNEGRNVWLDSINASGPYLTAPAGSTVNSTVQRYFQYRAILSTVDRQVSAYLTGAVTDYKKRAGGGVGIGRPFIF